MTMIQLIACIGMIAGLFIVLHVSPRELSDSLFSRLTAAPGSIRADINETTRRKKAGFLRREITEAQAVLAASGRADRFPMVCFTSLLCFALGACIAIAAGNAFLVPVLAVGLMLTPFWYVKLTAGSFKKDVAAELETALSVITTAYLRTENFQQAVEENVRYLHPPVQEVFQRFLMRIKHIDPDMDAALTDLKAAIDNEVWREWCDAVMACQADRSLKSILTPIVSKLSDMRVVNAELENLVFGPRKEFITMAILVLINIPLVRFINKDWYHTLVATIPGQMVIAVCLAAVFVSFAFVVKLTQPIEYRRWRVKLLLFLFGAALAAGLYFVLADLLKIPRLATERALISAGRKERSLVKSMETLVLGWSLKLAPLIRLDAYKRRRLETKLTAAGLDMTPEVFTAYTVLKPCLILLGIIPCLLILPILTPLVVVLALLTYFKESRRADELCKARMELVEGELPRFVATIHQELAASRDVLRILENYKKHAGPDFARELDVLTADMRSSSYEAALIRFEARMGSAIISDIVRGLVGILRGDDGRMYFQMLSHDLKALELQRLKAKAAKIPPKIRVFSFLMLMCFMLTYIVIIVYQIINSLGALF